jgi:hypothetical protein
MTRLNNLRVPAVPRWCVGFQPIFLCSAVDFALPITTS